VSTACASGATALGVGAELVREGVADVVVAGGYDVLCRFVMKGFDVLRALTRDAIRPFDRRRSGTLLGEGAGLVLLAREQDAADGPRLGRLLGHASGSDGSHIAAPDPNGRGLEYSVRAALAEAGVAPAAIDFVSAHGTATRSTTVSRPPCSSGARAAGARDPGQLDQGLHGPHDGGGRDARGDHVPPRGPPRCHPTTVGLEDPDPECDSITCRGRRARLAADYAQYVCRLWRMQREPRSGGA